ncbi:lyase [Snodgrassella sp. ESL0323]|uniref:HEAT repeat domain-containing protein n=1 Tax=Snodgrassella sp. ESL0323 TaxID=2705034 RepID=UPI001583BC01|nr:HEAT repeat domain-containing protein [Snodgrassella sp. ESL0323]NUF77797.1 lyase [Snodgrassella sp. ESL0323]
MVISDPEMKTIAKKKQNAEAIKSNRISKYDKNQEDFEFQYWEQCRHLSEKELVALLSHDNFSLSLEAAKALLLIGGSKVIKLAQADSYNNSYKRRALAAFILGQIRLNTKEEKNSLKILYDLALNDQSAIVRSYVVLSFGQRCKGIKNKNLDSLLALAQKTILDKSFKVRANTAIALSMFDYEVSIPLLIKLLKDTHSEVKNWAAFAVNVNGYDTPEIRNCFVLLLKENNFDVRYEAITGLAKRLNKSVAQLIIQELSEDKIDDRMIELISYLRDVSLLPVLYQIKDKFGSSKKLNMCIENLEKLKVKTKFTQ